MGPVSLYPALRQSHACMQAQSHKADLRDRPEAPLQEERHAFLQGLTRAATQIWYVPLLSHPAARHTKDDLKQRSLVYFAQEYFFLSPTLAKTNACYHSGSHSQTGH